MAAAGAGAGATAVNDLQTLTSSVDVIDVDALDEQFAFRFTTSSTVSGVHMEPVYASHSTTLDSVTGPGSHVEPVGSTTFDSVSGCGSQVDLVTSLDSATTSESGSNMEPVTAVIARYLQRAITAPPTIKQFFKPKPAGNDITTNTSENEPERNDLIAGDGISGKEEEEEDDDDDVIVTASADDQLASKVKSLQRESVVPRKLSKTAPSSRKRGKSSTMPAAKKHKQSSIAALFSAGNTQKQPPVMQCPICSWIFDESVSNAEVNQHIDGCLIE